MRLRKTYEVPAEIEEDGLARRWTIGVAASALLVAGTFAASTLGLGDGEQPFAADPSMSEYAPTAPGEPAGPGDRGEIGGPAVVPPRGENARALAPDVPDAPDRVIPAPRPVAGQSYLPPSTPAPAPAPAPVAAPAPAEVAEPAPGPVEQVVTPVAETVDDTADPLTGTVSGVLSPVTGVLGGGDQPALTMIDPAGDLLGL